MSLTLPLRSDLPSFSFSVELDGVTYGFEFRWNGQAGTWVMNLLTSDDDPIITGVRVVVDWALAQRYADARLPPGMLVMQDTTGKRENPGRDDLGTRALLLYFTAEEVGNT